MWDKALDVLKTVIKWGVNLLTDFGSLVSGFLIAQIVGLNTIGFDIGYYGSVINAWIPLNYGIGLLASYFGMHGVILAVRIVLRLLP